MESSASLLSAFWALAGLFKQLIVLFFSFLGPLFHAPPKQHNHLLSHGIAAKEGMGKMASVVQ